MVLDQTQILHRNADTGSDHRHMQVDADGLGVDRDHAVLVNIAVAVVRLEVQVRLTRAVALDLNLLAVGNAVPCLVSGLKVTALVVPPGLQSLICMVAGHVILGERITFMAIAGAVILIAGMILAVRKKRSKA